jgi:hypothetical protein
VGPGFPDEHILFGVEAVDNDHFAGGADHVSGRLTRKAKSAGQLFSGGCCLLQA